MSEQHSMILSTTSRNKGGRLIRWLRERRAQKRLAEIVRDTRDSYECRRYRERRAAALKGLGR